MRTVILYGELAKRFGKYHRFSVKTAAESIRALKANFKGFEKYMCEAHTNGIGFKVFVGGAKIKDYDKLADPSSSSEVIRFVPVLVGSKTGWTQVLIGVALIAVGVLITIGTFGTATPAYASFATSLILAGASLTIGGVINLLSPLPSANVAGMEDRENKTSYLFNGPANTSAQGRPVPIGYGRMIIGSVIISAGIETHEIS